jgi:hypothetical protein
VSRSEKRQQEKRSLSMDYSVPHSKICDMFLSRRQWAAEMAAHRVEMLLLDRLCGRSADKDAKFRAGDRARLARHRATQALALKNRRQIGGRAAGLQEVKEFHDTSPCKTSHGAASVVWTKAARLMHCI